MTEPREVFRGGTGESTVRPLILFDGVCNLCNGAVLWVIRRDTRRDGSGRVGRFDFASLQSRVAGAVLAESGAGARAAAEAGWEPPPDSIVLVDGPRLLTKSDAVLAIGRRLRFPWPLLARAGSIVPRRLRDAVYDWVARRRYRWFGRRDACRAPTPELEARFLDAAEWRSAPTAARARAS